MKIIPVNINPIKIINIPIGSLGLKILGLELYYGNNDQLSNSLKSFIEI